MAGRGLADGAENCDVEFMERNCGLTQGPAINADSKSRMVDMRRIPKWNRPGVHPVVRRIRNRVAESVDRIWKNAEGGDVPILVTGLEGEDSACHDDRSENISGLQKWKCSSRRTAASGHKGKLGRYLTKSVSSIRASGAFRRMLKIHRHEDESSEIRESEHSSGLSSGR